MNTGRQTTPDYEAPMDQPEALDVTRPWCKAFFDHPKAPASTYPFNQDQANWSGHTPSHTHVYYASNKYDFAVDQPTPNMVDYQNADHMERLKFESFTFSKVSDQKWRAEARLWVYGELKTATAYESSPMKAFYKAINDFCRISVELEDYFLESAWEDTEEVHHVSVRLRDHEHFVTGQATHADATKASALAYVNAMNQVAEQRYQAAKRARYLGYI